MKALSHRFYELLEAFELTAFFFEVTIRTIENYLASNENELHHNGYKVL